MRLRLIPLLAIALIIFSVSLALLIGEIGFEGDDWWQFSWPYWYPFPQSIWEYAKESRRPIEGIYTVLAFESFGLNRIFYTLTALLLSAGSCLLLASCLKRAYPKRSSLAVLSAFFAFFLTPISNLIYMFHTDNSRLSMLFFWSSVFAFQRWARSSCSWPGLLPPTMLYLLGAFTYENTTFLIFCIPLLVWPVYAQDRKALSNRDFVVRLLGGIFGAFTVFVLVRFAVFSGGAVKQSSLIPPLHLTWSYLANLVFYTVYPLYDIPWDLWSWLLGALVGLVLAALLFYSSKSDSFPNDQRVGCWDQSSIYVASLGLLFLILGMLPYLMAGYNSSIGFTSQSRVYSSGAFGLAIFLGALASTPSNRKCRCMVQIFAVVAISLMAVFLADLRKGWQEAATDRSRLCESLLKQAPAVAPHTTFLFLGLQSYISSHGVDRAVVFQGVDGLAEWVRMLYQNKKIYAYFLYPNDKLIDDKKGRKASVSPEGVSARGSVVRGTIPLDTILIIERHGDELHVLEGLSQSDEIAAITWQGISHIESNMNLILPVSQSRTGVRSICGQPQR
ncbi:MAG: hypothetical protein NTY51_09490 [Deltaproteobacteria bacterium]|nr:hypothetical protein [Deltaproteobacteria bacterium]